MGPSRLYMDSARFGLNPRKDREKSGDFFDLFKVSEVGSVIFRFEGGLQTDGIREVSLIFSTWSWYCLLLSENI